MSIENKRIELEVAREIVDIVESYDYEYSARKDVISNIVANGMSIDNDIFKKYQREMIEFNVQFNQAKKEVEEKYVIPATNGALCSWTLDYSTGKLTIDIKE